MTHPEWQTALDAYVAGELNSPASDRLFEHLNTCASCRDEADALKRIVNEAAQLPRSIEPPPHVWWRIAGELREPSLTASIAPAPPRTSSRFRFALAAIFLVAVFGAAALLSPRRPESTRSPTAAETAASKEPDVVVISNDAKAQPSEWAQMIWSLEEESLNAEKAVFAGLAGHVDAAGLKRASAVEPALAALDTAITETADAMRLQPDNAALGRTLTGYYERKLQLLRVAARLAAGSWA
jgi:anti-sigma factor RsiW